VIALPASVVLADFFASHRDDWRWPLNHQVVSPCVVNYPAKISYLNRY
jgi:hypothetical protein